jgi:hypothetical protein
VSTARMAAARSTPNGTSRVGDPSPDDALTKRANCPRPPVRGWPDESRRGRRSPREDRDRTLPLSSTGVTVRVPRASRCAGSAVQCASRQRCGPYG